ncbi:MAG: hypothetical protein JXQ84_03755 [Rhodospirillaceae bacterium]|nr:hypothetical protein [Rhodospirillaceae bacterium]
MRLRYLSLMFAAVLVAGCQSSPSASSYQRNQAMQTSSVSKGKIVSLRDVEISGSQSGVGLGAGAVAGGVTGSYLGGGSRANILGALGGAVLGGAAGAVAENAVTKGTAVEFIVQKDNGQTIAVVQANEQGLAIGERVLILQGGDTRLVRDTSIQ